MRWGKILLLFQAAVTLVIGVAFFSQLTIIGASDISDLITELVTSNPAESDVSATLNNLRARYTVASYMLLVVGLIEVIIIMRLFS
jgi:large-conductance mechanosensitive channel